MIYFAYSFSVLFEVVVCFLFFKPKKKKKIKDFLTEHFCVIHFDHGGATDPVI